MPTSPTKIIDMIENHDYDNFITVVNNDSKFDPNGGTRYKHYLSTAVYLNNFMCFQKLINHPNYDGTDHGEFVNKIIYKVSKCDNENNRRFLNELMNINFKFTCNNIKSAEGTHLYYELFNYTGGVHAVLLLSNINNPSEIDDFLLKYLIDNNPIVLTKELLDNTILLRALNSGNLYLLNRLNNEGFDILTINGKSSVAYIIGHNIANLNCVVDFYFELKPHYNKNLITELFPNNYNDQSLYKHGVHPWAHSCIYIKHIINNYDKIKGMYNKIVDSEMCNLVTLITDCVIYIDYNYRRHYMYSFDKQLHQNIKDNADQCIDFLIQQKISTPLPNWILASDIKQILTKKATDKNLFDKMSLVARPLFLKYYAYGFEPNDETKQISTFIFHSNEIVDMDKLIKETIIQPVVLNQTSTIPTKKKSSKKK